MDIIVWIYMDFGPLAMVHNIWFINYVYCDLKYKDKNLAQDSSTVELSF